MIDLPINKVNTEIMNLKNYWTIRNNKFREWYEYLLMIDKLASRGMESYVSNEPATFYKMAHYLLTKGEMSHFIPVVAESALDLDRRARVHRGCQYMWNQIDRKRRLGGNQSYIDDICFYILVLGWYATILSFDQKTGSMQAQLWNPADVFPSYSNDTMTTCVHSYSISQEEALTKAKLNSWKYQTYSSGGSVSLDDVFVKDEDQDIWYNMVLLDGKDVTGWVDRPELRLFVAPIGGYPDKGSITSDSLTWRGLTGVGIFEVNETVASSFNKWKSMISQILRDTAQPIMQEFSATSQATPEQIRERGALFHYAPGEAGLNRVPPAVIPMELQSNLLELRREMQKGSFNDAVYGMVSGEAGYALSLLATSSANQILYPYMDAKHFVVGEADKFWLENLKSNRKSFAIKGKLIEEIKPADIPEDVNVIVESDVATPKDWLERGTIGGMVREDLDKATLLTEIYKLPDPQGILRRKSLDRTLDHPMTQQIEMIAGYRTHANYLDSMGDREQANLFRKAADAMEGQLGAPAPGQGTVQNQDMINRQREAGAPAEVPTVPSNVTSPEGVSGFTPQQLRRSIGSGKIKVR